MWKEDSGSTEAQVSRSPPMRRLLGCIPQQTLEPRRNPALPLLWKAHWWRDAVMNRHRDAEGENARRCCCWRPRPGALAASGRRKESQRAKMSFIPEGLYNLLSFNWGKRSIEGKWRDQQNCVRMDMWHRCIYSILTALCIFVTQVFQVVRLFLVGRCWDLCNYCNTSATGDCLWSLLLFLQIYPSFSFSFWATPSRSCPAAMLVVNQGRCRWRFLKGQKQPT